MMAEKARVILDHDTADRNMASPDPRENKRLGRGVQNFNCATWDRVQEDAVLAGSFGKFTQNPVIKQHLVSTGTKRLAQASPSNPVCGIGLRADDPEAQDPSRWRGKSLLWKAPSAVRDILRLSEAGLAHPDSSHQFFTQATTDIIPEISPAPPSIWPWTAFAQVLLWSFRPIFLTRRLITAPRLWLSHLVSSPLSRCQNTALASSRAPKTK